MLGIIHAECSMYKKIQIYYTDGGLAAATAIIGKRFSERGVTLSDEAFATAAAIDESLPEWGRRSWRWRIVYLRALLDSCRYRLAAQKVGPGNDFHVDYKSLIAGNKLCQDAFAELIEIFLCEKKYSTDPYYCRVRPLTD